MPDSGSSPYFKSESHQMKLALSFPSQILLVFLPGREREPFHTLTLIQNSKNSSSYLLKGKAVQGPDIEGDGGSIPQPPLPPPPNLIILGAPISRGLMVWICSLWRCLKNHGQAVHDNNIKATGLMLHWPTSFKVFHRLMYTMANVCYWSKGWVRKSRIMVQLVFIIKEGGKGQRKRGEERYGTRRGPEKSWTCPAVV